MDVKFSGMVGSPRGAALRARCVVSLVVVGRFARRGFDPGAEFLERPVVAGEHGAHRLAEGVGDLRERQGSVVAQLDDLSVAVVERPERVLAVLRSAARAEGC